MRFTISTIVSIALGSKAHAMLARSFNIGICIYRSTNKLFICLQDIFSGSTHLSDSSTLILERVDRHHAGVYQCAADNGVREPVSMDINLTILCEFCSMADDKFPIELPYSDSIVLFRSLQLFFFWRCSCC